MAGDLTDAGASYSSSVGLIYVFNLIVGTGTLTMPRAFADAGWLISLVFLCVLCFMSYMTVTFVIESMAAANAIRRYTTAGNTDGRNGQVVHQLPREDRATAEEDERSPLIAIRGQNRGHVNNEYDEFFEIRERIEMGQMASLFFNKVGVNLFYICIAIYLYGDLAIYAAAVPKSLRDVACTYKGSNSSESCNTSLTDADICWESAPDINRGNAYRIFLAIFTLCLGPFLFFDVQKTKYLQLFTTLMRWLAFSMMIVLAIIRLSRGEGRGHPAIANFSGVPTLFGVCVYSFMCHHSLPSLATPIRNKSRLSVLFLSDYLLILVFYTLLSLTGVFSFAHLQDLYTLNFQPNACEAGEPITRVAFIQYFLALFPVFVLSANFPIIGITLRNNLKSLFLREDHTCPRAIVRLAFPLAAFVPPVIVAFITNQVEFLVGVTGSYAGAGVQYFIPAFLLFCSRRTVSEQLGPEVPNPHRSPFSHLVWFIFVLVWGILCISFVTVNHIITGK